MFSDDLILMIKLIGTQFLREEKFISNCAFAGFNPLQAINCSMFQIKTYRSMS